MNVKVISTLHLIIATIILLIVIDKGPIPTDSFC